MESGKNKKQLKICLAASAGGHTTQLLAIKQAWADSELFWITTSELLKPKLSNFGRVYFVDECNRSNPLKLVKVFFKCIFVIFNERPDIVISSGAAVGCITALIGRLIGAKVIWLDSITNVEKPSLSGRIVYHFADLFLVQWPHLAEKCKNAEYVGAVI